MFIPPCRKNVCAGGSVTTVPELLSLIQYLCGKQELLFFRRERTQRRHLTFGGLKPVRILILFPFTADKKPFSNCWEVCGGDIGLYRGGGQLWESGGKSVLQLDCLHIVVLFNS